MMGRRIDKRFLIAGAWLLPSGVLIAACGGTGDTGSTPTAICAPTVVAPGGGSTGCPGYADPSHCPPFTTGGPYSISGVVTLRTASGTVGVAGTHVGGYVFTNSGNGYRTATVLTDSVGRYQLPNLPDGRVVLWGGASRPDYQPCAAIAVVNGANATADVVLVDSAVARSMTPADSPMLSGLVYRTTSAGREPVSGAYVDFEYFPDLVTATTVTDAQGRYSLCRLPLGGTHTVWFVADGVMVERQINITGDQVLDVVLTP